MLQNSIATNTCIISLSFSKNNNDSQGKLYVLERIFYHELFAAYTCREKLIEMRSTKRYATVLNKSCESWAYQYVGGVKKLRDLSKYFKWVRLLYFRYILSRKMTLQQLDLFIPFVSFNVAKFHCYKHFALFLFPFPKTTTTLRGNSMF